MRVTPPEVASGFDGVTTSHSESSDSATTCRTPSSSARLTISVGAPAWITLVDAEREHILGALVTTGSVVGGPRGAAARLGMKRSTLQNEIQKLGIAGPA